MKVSIKDLSVNMDVKNRGVELDVYDGEDTHLGDLVITRSKLIWCKGKTGRTNGRPISWKKFIAFMESDD